MERKKSHFCFLLLHVHYRKSILRQPESVIYLTESENSAPKPSRDVRKMAVTMKKILVVDDDKSVLRTFTLILKKDGFDVDTAENGKEALEKANVEKYHAVLIDFRLPDMDGTDLLPKFQKIMPNAVKIIITGFPSLETGVKSLDFGADAYLVKPVKPPDLLALIRDKIAQKN